MTRGITSSFSNTASGRVKSGFLFGRDCILAIFAFARQLQKEQLDKPDLSSFGSSPLALEDAESPSDRQPPQASRASHSTCAIVLRPTRQFNFPSSSFCATEPYGRTQHHTPP
jgi:hypothetical protein